jgi:hypothetical protein
VRFSCCLRGGPSYHTALPSKSSHGRWRFPGRSNPDSGSGRGPARRPSPPSRLANRQGLLRTLPRCGPDAGDRSLARSRPYPSSPRWTWLDPPVPPSSRVPSPPDRRRPVLRPPSAGTGSPVSLGRFAASVDPGRDFSLRGTVVIVPLVLQILGRAGGTEVTRRLKAVRAPPAEPWSMHM